MSVLGPVDERWHVELVLHELVSEETSLEEAFLALTQDEEAAS